jgi:glucose 1-dehydrogenase
MRLDGKVALVTGSSRGIGRAIALRFAREGADLVVNYNRDQANGQQAVEEIRACGRRAELVRADVSRVGEARSLVAEAVARMGALDILVNNAGMEMRAPFWEVTEEDYDRIVDLNLKAVFFTSQAVVQYLRERKRPGKIINISSIHEELPFPHFAPYCAAKGGVRMLTRTLAVELGSLGITVNGIAPGAIETAINRGLMCDPKKLDPLLQQIPLGHIGKPADVAGVAAFLASPDADYVTGSTYFIDGGLTWNYEEQ